MLLLLHSYYFQGETPVITDDIVQVKPDQLSQNQQSVSPPQEHSVHAITTEEGNLNTNMNYACIDILSSSLLCKTGESSGVIKTVCA